jgi:GMP synthase (glutamine-hydrolysing)
MAKTALVIVQQASAHPGRVGYRLRGMGFRLNIRYPNAGDRLPPSPDGFDAVIIFGGPMSANDDGVIPGIRAQLDFLPGVFESETPTLGICLGAQLLARALGSTVKRHPEGLVEIGYHPIVPTAQGGEHFDGPMKVFQWHREGFDLPWGTTCLATGETFQNQAFRYGDSVYGIQFHPEVVRETIELWTTKAPDDLVLPGAQSRDDQLGDFDLCDPAIDRWFETFLGKVFT